MSNPMGRRGSLEKLRRFVSGLVVNERLEVTENQAILTRQYAETLIAMGVNNGRDHVHTREMVDWWLPERGVKKKFYEVLVPRLKD